MASFQDSIVRLREIVHQNPELGNREFETARRVADHLRSLDFDEVRTGIAHTGVVGILRGGWPGPVVAVRADMDALPVTEDFACYANEIPGFFFRLGQVKPGGRSGGHHTPDFQADSSAFPMGMRAMTSLLLDYLKGGAPAGK